MMEESFWTPTNKKRVILAVVAAIVLYAVYWVATHSYIEIIVSNGGSGEYSYAIFNQGDQKNSQTKSTETKIKKLVRKGSYEITVKQGDKSHFAVVSTKGFLGRADVKAELQPEKSRAFVGNNPSPCMFYAGNRLFSFTCRGQTGDIKLHVPATKDRPTFVQSSPESLEGTVEEIFGTGGEDFVLVRGLQQTNEETDSGADFVAYPLRADLKLNEKEGILLPDLRSPSAKHYIAKPLGDGVVIYDESFNKAFLYTSLKEPPSKLNLEDSTDKKLTPYALSAHNQAVAVMYGGDTDDAALENDIAAKQKSELVVSGSGNAKHFTFSKRYSSGALCGQGKFCGLFDDKLDVFDISGDKAKLLYSVSRVHNIDSLGDGTLLLDREGEIIGFSADNRSGTIHYSLGEYKSCGIKPRASDYTLCVINHQQRKVALHIDTGQTVSDEIDKKISELLKISQIRDVSIYRDAIFISPDLGQVVFVEERGEYGYSPATIKRASDAINRKIDELGIDRSKYTIVNTFE